MLKGKSIFLRSVEKEDATKLMIWENNPEHWKVTGTEIPFSLQAILDFIDQAQHIRQHGQARFMICLNSTKESIGCIDLYNADFKHKRAAIGILIGDKENRNNGFALESINILVEYSKQVLDLQNLFCSVHADNTASLGLFEKAGFEVAGRRKDWFYEQHQWIDEILYQKCLREKRS